MLECRASRSDGSIAPVWLQRADDAPLTRVIDKYGSVEMLDRNLEGFLLCAERRRKQAGGTLSICEEGEVVGPEAQQPLGLPTTLRTRTWQDLRELLADIAAYASLGTLGGADQRVCDALQPLLLRLMKLLFSGLFVEDTENANDELTLVDQLIAAAEHATVNCSAGVARRTADTALVVDGTTLALQAPRQLPWLPPPGEQLVMTFGFADYTVSETAAMLWAGAVALSSFLMEQWEWLWTMLPPRAHDTARVLEVGCGPALVSLTIARLLQRQWTSASSSSCVSAAGAVLPRVVELVVTDIADAAVAEAHRSFAERNGPELARTLGDQNEAGAREGEAGGRSTSDGLRVHTRKLDLGDVTPADTGRYDLLVASDIVYDHALTELVTPALVALLAPGGLAVLCCEAHRDSMSGFVPHVRACFSEQLVVEKDIVNVEAELQWLKTDKALSDSTCRLMVLRRI